MLNPPGEHPWVSRWPEGARGRRWQRPILLVNAPKGGATYGRQGWLVPGGGLVAGPTTEMNKATER